MTGPLRFFREDLSGTSAEIDQGFAGRTFCTVRGI